MSTVTHSHGHVELPTNFLFGHGILHATCPRLLLDVVVVVVRYNDPYSVLYMDLPRWAQTRPNGFKSGLNERTEQLSVRPYRAREQDPVVFLSKCGVGNVRLPPLFSLLYNCTGPGQSHTGQHRTGTLGDCAIITYDGA